MHSGSRSGPGRSHEFWTNSGVKDGTARQTQAPRTGEPSCSAPPPEHTYRGGVPQLDSPLRPLSRNAAPEDAGAGGSARLPLQSRDGRQGCRLHPEPGPRGAALSVSLRSGAAAPADQRRVRARHPKRLPIVWIREEARRVLSRLRGTPRARRRTTVRVRPPAPRVPAFARQRQGIPLRGKPC
jgi:hypothetical protein